MKKNLVLVSSLLLTLIEAQGQRKPNIILIITDQQSSLAMSAVGNTYLNTPAMDALAHDGIRYENAYCTSPVSGPSRASIITGLMPSQVGMDWNDNSRFKVGTQTMADMLNREGYRSVLAGKWHLPEIYPQRTLDQKITKHGFEFLSFSNAPDRMWLMGSHTDPLLTQALVSFIESYDDERPLFLSVNYHNPHDICFVPRKDRYETAEDTVLTVRPFGRYRLPLNTGVHPDSIKAELPPLPNNFERDFNEPEFVTDKRMKPNGYGDEMQYTTNYIEKEWRAYIYNYYRLTEAVDAEIAKVVEALKRKGMYHNSVIILTSDHGDGMAAHRWAAKLSFYDEPTKVPFVLITPNGKRGVDEKLVSLCDIVPTCLHYAGVKSDIPFAGVSLKNREKRKYIVTELSDNPQQKLRKGRMVRSARYKYCIYSTGERNEQLFDMHKDSGEQTNVAYDPKYSKIMEQHRKYLKEWQERIVDNFKVNSK